MATLVLATLAAAPAVGPEATFKAHGLAVAGSWLVVPQESAAHDAVRRVRAAKAKVAADAAARKAADADLQRTAVAVNAAHARLKSASDNLAAHPKDNVAIGRYNSALQDAEHEDGQLIVAYVRRARMDESQAAYVTAVLAAADAAANGSHAYDAAAADKSVTAAVTAYNASARTPVALGPTPAFTVDLDAIAKASADVRQADVPVTIAGGVPQVEVVLNNGVRRPMIWDSGASAVSLTAETARAAGIVAKADDPTVTIVTADGSEVKVKEVYADALRVGPFTVRHVRCTVLPDKVKGADNLLGGTFQSHFQAKLDLVARRLSLTPLDDQTTADASAPTLAAATRSPAATKASPAADAMAARAAAGRAADERYRDTLLAADRLLLAYLGPAQDAAVRAGDGPGLEGLGVIRQRTQDRVDAGEPGFDALGYVDWGMRRNGRPSWIWTVTKAKVTQSDIDDGRANALTWGYNSVVLRWGNGWVERLTRVDDRVLFLETWEPKHKADALRTPCDYFNAARPTSVPDGVRVTNPDVRGALHVRDESAHKAMAARTNALAAADQKLLAALKPLTAGSVIDDAVVAAYDAAIDRLDEARPARPKTKRWRVRNNDGPDDTLTLGDNNKAKLDGHNAVARVEWAGNMAMLRWPNGYADRVTLIGPFLYKQIWSPDRSAAAPDGPMGGWGVGTPAD